MAAKNLLSQVSTALEPYINSKRDYNDIRLQLAKHIDSLQPHQDEKVYQTQLPPIPSYITGTRKRYIQAVRDNASARQRYAKVSSEVQFRNELDNNNREQLQSLQTHLETLELRQQYNKYITLLQHLSEAENLAEQKDIFDPYPVDHNTSLDNGNSIPQPQPAVLTQIRDLNRDLEVAVLQAHHQLQHERVLLEELKSVNPFTDAPTMTAQYYALNATQAALTEWIEESLAKCDGGERTTSRTQQSTSQHEDNQINHEATINEQYAKYLGARTSLLDIALALTSPVRSTTKTDADLYEAALTAAKRMAAKPTFDNSSSILAYIDAQYLPVLQQHQGLDQAKAHVTEIISRHEQDLAEQLLRLNEESHLLPAYPILAKTKADREISTKEKLLRAWAFAMEAASTATGVIAMNQIATGVNAVDEANAVLDENTEAEKMWTKLET